MPNTNMHGAHKCVRYYVLLVWDPEYFDPHHLGENLGGRWTIEYGSYERKDVKDEREYYHLSGEGTLLKHLRIKEICSCEAGTDDLLRMAQEEPRP